MLKGLCKKIYHGIPNFISTTFLDKLKVNIIKLYKFSIKRPTSRKLAAQNHIKYLQHSVECFAVCYLNCLKVDQDVTETHVL